MQVNNLVTAMNTFTNCQFCNEEYNLPNFKRHEASCYLNPKKLKSCPICDSPIKNYKTSVTCGYSCSNTYHRSGVNNPNWKGQNYRILCFKYHEKECIICGEDKIVEVHHYDGDNTNNSTENFVPLCPTHHQYYHSKYRSIINDKIDIYQSTFSKKMAGEEGIEPS